MGSVKRMGIVDFRAEVGKRVDAAFYLKEVTFITKGVQGEIRGVLIPPEYYTALKETLAAQGIELPAATVSVKED